jgi:hypothetical protein
MRDVHKLVEAHLHAWTVSDATERAAEIARIYTTDVTVVEPDGVVRGRDALNARIGSLQQHFSGLEFSLNGEIHHHNDYAMYEWRQPTAIRSEDVIGWDVLHFEGDRIDRAVMFISGFDALGVPGHAKQTD